LRATETYEKPNQIVTNYACDCSTTMLTSKLIKEAIEKFFNSIFINFKITYDPVMKNHHRHVVPLSKGRGEGHRSPAFLLTAISSHCLAALPPAKMSASVLLLPPQRFCKNH